MQFLVIVNTGKEKTGAFGRMSSEFFLMSMVESKNTKYLQTKQDNMFSYFTQVWLNINRNFLAKM
jgi:hypothetical protein